MAAPSLSQSPFSSPYRQNLSSRGDGDTGLYSMLHDEQSKHRDEAIVSKRRHSSWLQTLLFSDATPIYKLSQTRALDFGDLFELADENRTSVCYAQFHAKYLLWGRSLYFATVFTYGRVFALCGLGKLIVAACGVFAPVVLHRVVSEFSEDDVNAGTLSIWLVVFFASRVLLAVVSTQVENAVNHVAIRITAAMKCLLFRKVLRRRAANEGNVGGIDDPKRQSGENPTAKSTEISNIVTSDTNGVLYAVLAIHNVWILPLQIGIVTYLLYSVLDIAAFAGVGIVAASLGINYVIARVMGNSFAKLMRAKDERMMTVKEVFGSIQIVKFNAWENRFQEKLAAQRAVEVKWLTVYAYASAAVSFVLWSSPFFVSAVSFAVYVLILSQTLTAAKVFTAMALFNALRDPLRDLPATIQLLIQSRVSIRRLNNFLSAPEFDETNLEAIPMQSTSTTAIRIHRGTFGWGSTPAVRDINLAIAERDFVVIYGGVGSGKSSLLSAVLGEMNKLHGCVQVRGRIAYCSQQPWIQNMSIRENILFGSSFDPTRYNRVVDVCCLRDDLSFFPAGDITEIGEKGVNLSGGQKARVALARACYADADIYLLDSPLAAVDAVVQNRIFRDCLCGFLKSKTILMVTHNPEIIDAAVVNYRIHLERGQLIRCERTDQACERSASSLSPECIRTAKTMEEIRDEERMFVDNCDGILVNDEKREEGQIATTIWTHYVTAIGGFRLLVALLFVQLLWQGFQIGSDFWLSHWTGNAASKISPQETAHFVNIYSALASAGALMVLCQGVIVAYMGLKASSTMFGEMTAGLLHAPLRFFDANPIGRVINRYSDDIATVDLTIPTSCSTLLAAFFSMICALGTAAIVIKYAGLCMVPVLYFYARISSGYVRAFCDVRRMLKVVNSPILSHITQSEQGASSIRAFGGVYVDQAIDENDRRIDIDNALWDTEIVLLQWFTLRLQLLGCAIVMVVVSSFLIFSDWFSPGIVGLAFTYALSVDSSLMTLMKAWSKAENSMVSIERVHEYSVMSREGCSDVGTTTQVLVEPDENWPKRGEIFFDRVWFAYKPNDAAVLKNVTFCTSSHEKIGVVGRTGAGKSSLIMALMRINELQSGQILIDGVNAADVPLYTLRSRIAVIPQAPVLLEGTLRHFLDPFRDFSDNHILNLLENVQLMDILRLAANGENHSDVLQVQLQSNGDNFSVGERQMMCMTRALLRGCSVMIMDEATASIDHTTEQKLSLMMRRELQNVTLFTIAHRLATVLDNDRVIVLDEGRVIEFDSPQRLLESEGSKFRALVEAASLAGNNLK